MALGERIKEYRLKAHLSQEKVAELIGVSRQAITKWEMNQSAPNTENLFRLAEIFDTTVDLLVSDEAERPKSIAEQVHLLYRAEEAKKIRERRSRIRHNICIALMVLGGYLVIFLVGKLFSLPLKGTTVKGWLFDTDPRTHSYLFGWLLGNCLFLYASLISAVPALWGKGRYALTTLAGFALALPLGEFLGRHPEGAFYGTTHYGWAIWLLIFLLSVVMGIVLEHFRKEDISFRSKRFLLWCGIYLIGIIGSIVFVRLSMYP